MGLASYSPGPLKAGDTEAAVLARMGAPTERLALASGQRLVYARAPFGRHTWFMDLGEGGVLRTVTQVLAADRFEAVKPGMAQADLRAWLGPPTETRRLLIGGRNLWFWRFETFDCVWFGVTLDRDGRVLDAGNVPDPICDFADPG